MLGHPWTCVAMKVVVECMRDTYMIEYLSYHNAWCMLGAGVKQYFSRQSILLGNSDGNVRFATTLLPPPRSRMST